MLMRVRCPDSTHLVAPFQGPLYVVGCGHEFDAGDPHTGGPEAGMVDCPNCGMFFRFGSEDLTPHAHLTTGEAA